MPSSFLRRRTRAGLFSCYAHTKGMRFFAPAERADFPAGRIRLNAVLMRRAAS